MRCCGTLEFLCDFQAQCHNTQQEFQEKGTEAAVETVTKESSKPTDDDIEADKENAVPLEKFPSVIKKTSPMHSEICKIPKSSTAPDRSKTPDRPIVPEETGMILEKPLDNILIDITENHCKLPDSNVSKKPLSTTRSGTKRMRESSPSTRKTRRMEQKKLTDVWKPRPRESAESNKEETKQVDSKTVEKGKRVPVIVKQEKEKDLANEQVAIAAITHNPIKSNQLVWIPNAIELPEPETPKSQKNNKSQNDTICIIADEAEVSAIASVEVSTTPAQVVEVSTTGNEARKSVIERPRRTIETNTIDKVNDEERPVVKRRRGGTFGKMSELMSEEQKETIEKYYTIDMSVIDENRVRENCIVNDKKQIICKLCNLSYPRADKCYVHIWGHLEMKPYRCTACNFATVTVTNIRSHIRKSHLKIKPFECDVCQKRYVTAVLLEEHLNTHTGARPFHCKFCNFSSASRQVLSYHHKTHKAVKDITCDICKKQFYTKGRMRAHMLIHNKDKTLMCKFCSNHFTSSEALQRHYGKAHSKDYVCATCGKRTKSRKALHNHQNVHLEAKFKCMLCPNVYKSSHILKEHLLKHEGIRAYKCDVCNKDFAQQSHLAAHKAVHSEKRFKCPGCERPFNRQDNMKMHTKRCEAFLANPDLKDLLIRRKKSQTITATPDPEQNTLINEDVNNTSREKTEMQINNERRESFEIDVVDVKPIPETIEESAENPSSINITQSILSLECF